MKKKVGFLGCRGIRGAGLKGMAYDHISCLWIQSYGAARGKVEPKANGYPSLRRFPFLIALVVRSPQEQKSRQQDVAEDQSVRTPAPFSSSLDEYAGYIYIDICVEIVTRARSGVQTIIRLIQRQDRDPEPGGTIFVRVGGRGPVRDLCLSPRNRCFSPTTLYAPRPPPPPPSTSLRYATIERRASLLRLSFFSLRFFRLYSKPKKCSTCKLGSPLPSCHHSFLTATHSLSGKSFPFIPSDVSPWYSSFFLLA